MKNRVNAARDKSGITDWVELFTAVSYFLLLVLIGFNISDMNCSASKRQILASSIVNCRPKADTDNAEVAGALLNLFLRENVVLVCSRVLLVYTQTNKNNKLDGFMRNIRQIRFFIRHSMSYILR